MAPSSTLRRWFGHHPARWEEFQRRYFAELEAKPHAWKPLLEEAQKGKVTLLYAAKDEVHNHAVVLKAFLEAQGNVKAGGG